MNYSQHFSPVLSVEKCIKTVSLQKSFYVDLTHFFWQEKKSFVELFPTNSSNKYSICYIVPFASKTSKQECYRARIYQRGQEKADSFSLSIHNTVFITQEHVRE